VEINIEGAREVDDYLHLIEVTNRTENGKVVVIDINSTNANLPRSIRLLAGKSKEEHYFHKANPYAPLGKIEYQLTVSEHVENPKPFYRLYGNSYAPPPPEPIPEEPPAKQASKDEPMEVEQGAGFPQDADFPQDGDQINCPICTFYNAVTNTNCEVCGSPLNEA
jgi:hypothetical protein